MAVEVLERVGGDAPGAPALARAAKQGAKDRRITKTRTALRSALIELMEDRGFDSLSVGDICTRADITRGTFYNHFKDKEGLLEFFEDEVIADLAGLQERMAEVSLPEIVLCVKLKKPLPFLVGLFDYLRQEAPFLHAVMGPGGDVRFGPRMRDAVCTDLVQSILHEKYRTSPTAFVGYYVSFYASAYLGIIMRWIETGMAETSEEMALIAQRLLMIKPGEPIKL